MQSRKIQIISIGAFLFVAFCLYHFLSVHFQEKKFEAKLAEINSSITVSMGVEEVRSYLKKSSIQFREQYKEGTDWGNMDDIYADFYLQFSFFLKGPDLMLGLVDQDVMIKVRFNEDLTVSEVTSKIVYGSL
ncbi:MAG: hypothetical protein H6912_05555 [Kordiimonadaceae bacterium]|nr:hypothetical protein [Kordiimonadaceae bacterium]